MLAAGTIHILVDGDAREARQMQRLHAVITRVSRELRLRFDAINGSHGRVEMHLAKFRQGER